GDEPYNDLEFYLLLRGPVWWNELTYRAGIRKAAHELSASAGIEIEVKVLSLAKLQNSPASMFYYDLLMGHRSLWGQEDLFENCAHHRLGHRIPMEEATRLLMNRCSGLLFAKEKLAKPRI